MAEHGGGGSGVLREMIAVFGFGVDTHELKEGESTLNGFLEHVKHIGEAVAGAFAVEKIFDFAESNVKAMTEIEHASARLGVSTDKVQEFQFAAKSLGLESETLINLMGRLQVAQQGAAEGSGQSGKAFAALGVHVKDSNGHLKSADELFEDVAEGISNLKDPSKQAAVATQLFGRQGRVLLPFLKEGKKGIKELGEQYHALGGGYTKEAIEDSAKFEKESAKLNLTITSLKNVFLRGLLPVLNWLLDKGAKVVAWFREMTKNSNIVQAALVVLGVAATAFAVKMAIAFAPILLILAAVAAAVLIIDDIITMFKGGDSVTGDFIDKIFGKDAHLEVVEKVKVIWESIRDSIGEAVENIKIFIQLIDDLLPKKNKYQEFFDKVRAQQETDEKNTRQTIKPQWERDQEARQLFINQGLPPPPVIGASSNAAAGSSSSSVVVHAPINIEATEGREDIAAAAAARHVRAVHRSTYETLRRSKGE